MTTTFQKLLINVSDQSDLPLLYALRNRYGYGIGISETPVEEPVTAILFHKFQHLVWHNPLSEQYQKSTLNANSGQIKKIVTWLESDYEPPVKISVGDFVVVADEGKIKIRKDEITANELQAIVNALNGIDLSP